MTEQSHEAAANGDAPPLPDEYAIVEVFGHRRHAGRILEVERFGTKLLRIDIPKDGDFAAGYESHYYGGASIFSLTPTTLEVVTKMNQPYRPALPYTRAAAERDGVVEREFDDDEQF